MTVAWCVGAGGVAGAKTWGKGHIEKSSCLVSLEDFINSDFLMSLSLGTLLSSL